MSLPLATTTVTVRRSHGDPYDPDPTEPIAAGTPAHFGYPSGSETRAGGERSVTSMVLLFPATPPLSEADTVIDDPTGQRWEVTWVARRRGVGLDHQRAGVRRVMGAASG